MYVSSFVLKRISDAYEISNPDDDGVPILQIDNSRLERFKLKWPRFFDRKSIERLFVSNTRIANFVIPYKRYDQDREYLQEFIFDLKQLASEKFIQKYGENPPAWYREQIDHIFSL